VTFPEWNGAYEAGRANGAVAGFLWGAAVGIAFGVALSALLLAFGS
jgi:hypothetical protein